MDKLGRNYALYVQEPESSVFQPGQEQYILIEPPFTLEFDIARDSYSSANTGTFRIYNLSEKTRNKIRKDQWQFDVFRRCQLRAGYGKNLSLVFDGSISQGFSGRQNVDYVTEISAFDGGFAMVNGSTDVTLPAGMKRRDALIKLMDTLPGVQVGAVGDLDGELQRGLALSGNTHDLIREITGDQYFIDNGKAFFLQEDETVEGEVLVIDASTGLLETPVREQYNVHVKMIFEPRLQIGQKVQLKSRDASFNGEYRVIGLKHHGTISAAVGGDCQTSCTLVGGEFNFADVAFGV